MVVIDFLGENMLLNYYVSKKINEIGFHSVHSEKCDYLPLPHNMLFLGCFESCHDAIKKASTYYDKVDGCESCCALCHCK
ncbi:MAG: hypothetical protein PHV37_05590 [Candidatus Gastranaerophilales bacterium]|nr:hypothetical protein [Candidatus Gastranaerophilales bacterium]